MLAFSRRSSVPGLAHRLAVVQALLPNVSAAQRAPQRQRHHLASTSSSLSSSSSINNAPVRSLATASTSSSSQSHITRTPCGLFVDRSLPKSLDKVLIANRGEIACRVIRTAKELGIRTVAVYSDADKNALHVQMADEAYRIGGAPAKESYLVGEKIIEIAKRSGAQAIHPGYGFLSENAGFAALCEKEGVIFIGPPASAITAMGSKSGSKIIMTAAKVPVVPGYWGDNQDPHHLKQQADKCGYPLMLKAVSGGGGKGMRIVLNADEFPEMLEACKREAMNSFSDDRVLMERYIVRPRHIEFQVFADRHGNAVHLYERDCSVQRRHQKVLEEAPAPGMSAALRQQMGQSAVDAAKAVGYVGAGTVEFIFDAETDEYYFMEMNTRLQVEHPVTEMIMQRDLVQWQFHVAAGHKLPVTQAELNRTNTGHAIEARIYAENPAKNFLPCTGHLTHLVSPVRSPEVRVETGVRQGDSVSMFYDPMIAKLCVWAPDRHLALRRLLNSLKEYEIVGPPTNVSFLQKCVAHARFEAGKVETGFIAQHLTDLIPPIVTVSEASVVLAALSVLRNDALRARLAANASTDPNSPWASTNGFRVAGEGERTLRFNAPAPADADAEGPPKPQGVKEWAVTVKFNNTTPSLYQIKIVKDNKPTASDKFFTVEDKSEAATALSPAVAVRAFVRDQMHRASVVRDGDDIHVFSDGDATQFVLPQAGYGKASDHLSGAAVSPMAGKVVKVMAAPGTAVAKGKPLLIMEAMKMEHVIRAPHDGVVESVACKEGDFVEGGKLLVTFQEKAASNAKAKK